MAKTVKPLRKSYRDAQKLHVVDFGEHNESHHASSRQWEVSLWLAELSSTVERQWEVSFVTGKAQLDAMDNYNQTGWCVYHMHKVISVCVMIG